ncbi:MAG TPA: hypothetical protein VGN08_01075 [Solirubrobacteraceae bacterium]
MRLRRRSLILLAAGLFAALIVLPAVAGSETGPATVTAINSEGVYKEQRHSWSPAAVTVTAGGAVTFANPSSEVRHGLEWTGGPSAPSCTGLPSGSLGATGWRGECSFAQPGTYTFRCSVHPYEMTGTVSVNPNGTTTTTTTASPEPAPSGGGSPTTAPAALTQPAAPSSLLAGGAARALRLARTQRGRSVSGSVNVSEAGAGGRLEVDLLAPRAALAGAAHGLPVRIGRLVRAPLHAGVTSFKVSLNALGRRSLRAHGRLALSVRIVLSAGPGAGVTITRAVVLHS